MQIKLDAHSIIFSPLNKSFKRYNNDKDIDVYKKNDNNNHNNNYYNDNIYKDNDDSKHDQINDIANEIIMREIIIKG